MIDFSAMQPQAPPPSYWWTDPSGNPRPGTAPGADNGIIGPILRRVAALVQSVPQAQPLPQFHPTAVPGWLQQLRGAPDPGAAFNRSDPLQLAARAEALRRRAAPVPRLHRGSSLAAPGIGLEALHPGVGLESILRGLGIENLHRGPGIETLNPRLGL